jgi:magnesium transporter
VPYPGFSKEIGFAVSVAVMVVAGLVLYAVFRRKDWL